MLRPIHFMLAALSAVTLAVAQADTADNTTSNGAADSAASAAQAGNATRATLTVTVVNPHYRQVTRHLAANGSIEAQEIASVTAQTSSLSLNRIHVDIGDHVKKGQVLAEYDAASVYNDIAQAKAALTQAQIAYRQASANAKRARGLGKSHAISAIERDNYRYQAQMAKAKVAAAKAVLNNQQLRANYAKVKAQVNGTILEKQAVLGSVGNPGTPLFSMIVNNQLEWRASVPSELLHQISTHMPVEVTLVESSTTAADSEKNRHIAGKVRKIDPIINRQTRQGTVYVSLQNDPRLRLGMFLRGIFLIGDAKVLVVPIGSIIRKDGYNYVFVVGEDNRVARKKVAIGQLQGKGITILSGLKASDRVVSTGVGFLSHGDLVNISAE